MQTITNNAEALDPSIIFFISNIEVNPNNLSLTIEDIEYHIHLKMIEIIIYLAKKPGQLVTRQELKAAIWGDIVVNETGITHYIAQIRKLFKYSSSQSRFIKTLPKKGYCLMAPVRQIISQNITMSPSKIPPMEAKVHTCSYTIKKKYYRRMD